MSGTGSGGYQNQARVAADGADAGPSIGPNRGPTDRRDVIVAVGAIALVVLGVVLAITL